ncbi:MAG: NADP-dependent malic enzyme [Tenericutes bacterium]|nr:NADP-dependent malic enzyme [Mycoplasmatota bacterium]
MDTFKQKTLDLHKKNIGKLDLVPNIPLETKDDMSMAYTPGVAIPCLEIVKDKSKAYEYTTKGKTVAIVTDGTAVLGLGDIGPEAAMPVMEGKSALLYKFSGIQAVPICLATKDPDEIIKTVKHISPTFCGIMLEDIKAPECVYIENRLQEELDIPVFHDDQHGTAIVVGAALKNALRYLKRDISDQKIVVCGTGAAGNAIIRTLNKMGAKHIYGINTRGVLSECCYDIFNNVEQDIIKEGLIISPKEKVNSLAELMVGKDVFIGVSARNILTEDMVKSMNDDPIVFAMANPDPEIMPDLAKNAGASIVGTGRSDFPNQINNVLIFPGLMKGIVESRAKSVTFEIKLNALNAIASLVSDEELSAEFILPSIFDERVVTTVCEAVKKAKK